MLGTLQSGTYNLNGLLPSHWLEWDDYDQRLSRYSVLDGYYHNVAYHTISTYSQQLKHTERLYKHVRGVYNPAARLVESYVSKVYGGILDMQDANSGAIPIKSDNPALTDAIVQLWRDSRWGAKKSLYVRNGAKFGDTFLSVVDDIHTGIVYLEPVNPAKVKTVQTDSRGVVTGIVFEYYIQHAGQTKLFTMTITPDSYKTEFDGNEVALNTNARGEVVSEWQNEYGFVPVTHTMHRDVGLEYGANAWYTSMHKINELNDLASIQNDGARRQVQMPLFGFGLNPTSQDLGADKSNDPDNTNDTPRKDTQTFANFDKDGRLEAIAPVLDLANSLSLTKEILAEIERDLPELSLHHLREGANATAPGVRAAYDDAIARIQEARGNYDEGLVNAQKMTVSIGGMRGYKGYDGFNLMSLENGSVDHYIESRPVINDSLSVNEQIILTLQAMSNNAPAPVYGKIGWTTDETDEIIVAQESNTSAFINSGFEPPQDAIPDEAPEDAVNNTGIANINESDILSVEDELLALA